SVTMPHKQRLLTLVDIVDPLAQTVGAANTVVAQRSGTGPALLAAFNTDVAGIVGALRETAGPAAAGGGTAFVLGSGATACSALATRIK
ncbi:putative shikimate dehydrogenase, partial [human gut metagenome]